MVSWLKRHVGMAAVVTFVGAAISALGSVSGLPAPVVVFGALVAAGGALWSETDRTKFEHELRNRSDEIARLNRRIADSVMGGDSYRFLSIGVEDHSKDAAFAWVFHKGEHPLYDVNLTVIKSEDMQRAKHASFAELSHVRTEFSIGNMTQGETRLWRNWQLPDKGQQSYDVFIKARNGSVRQKLKFKKVDGRWSSATRVMRPTKVGTSTVLFERIDERFLRNEQGDVEWD